MAQPPLLTLAGIRFHLGDQTILDGVDLAVAPGERLSLVGRNGAGKSSLLRILAGEPINDAGNRFAQPGTTVATLPQEPQFCGSVRGSMQTSCGSCSLLAVRRKFSSLS